jgi:hypothetical protein
VLGMISRGEPGPRVGSDVTWAQRGRVTLVGVTSFLTLPWKVCPGHWGAPSAVPNPAQRWARVESSPTRAAGGHRDVTRNKTHLVAFQTHHLGPSGSHRQLGPQCTLGPARQRSGGLHGRPVLHGQGWRPHPTVACEGERGTGYRVACWGEGPAPPLLWPGLLQEMWVTNVSCHPSALLPRLLCEIQKNQCSD